MIRTDHTVNAGTGTVTVDIWNTGTGQYTQTVDGVETESRPLTADELAALTAAEQAQTEYVNEATLYNQVETNIAVLLDAVVALNEITSRTNTVINGNAAAAIKDLTREVKTVARQTIRVARLVADATDSTDSGT